MFKEGNTTSAPHVLSVIRTNVMLASAYGHCRRLIALLVLDYLPVWAASLLRRRSMMLVWRSIRRTSRRPETKTLTLGSDEEAATGHDDVAWLNA
jgi:hypothetical protein